MVLPLTPEEYFNYLCMVELLEKRERHPLKCPDEKEKEVLKRLKDGLSDRRIEKELHTTGRIIQRVKKKYGLWGR